jgi:hypothetical protein
MHEIIELLTKTYHLIGVLGKAIMKALNPIFGGDLINFLVGLVKDLFGLLNRLLEWLIGLIK